MKIGVKVGSKLLTDGNGKINKEIILRVCEQIVKLMRRGNCVFLVSSGAVASDPHKERSKNLRAAIGQLKLMNLYTSCFDLFGVEAAQLLLTDKDLSKSNIITKKVIEECFKCGVIPVINGNDVVDDAEIRALEKCADNDILFQLVCELIQVDIAMICFDMPGLIDNKGKVIKEVRTLKEILPYIKSGNELGYGKEGMMTKVKVLSQLSKKGIKAKLVCGKKENFILKAVYDNNFGTLFK